MPDTLTIVPELRVLEQGLSSLLLAEGLLGVAAFKSVVRSMATSVPDRSDPPASRSALPVTVAGSGERTTGTTCATSCATIVTAPEALWYPGLSYATA